MWPVLVSWGWVKVTVWSIYVVAGTIWASFMVWRRWREEANDEEIFNFTLWLTVWAVMGAVIWSLVEYGRVGMPVGWGIVGAVAAGGWWWCRKKGWDWLEIMDFLAVLGLWLWWAGSIAWGPAARWATVAASGGIVLEWYVRRFYRRFRWYKSGKMGLVGLTGLWWVA